LLIILSYSFVAEHFAWRCVIVSKDWRGWRGCLLWFVGNLVLE